MMTSEKASGILDEIVEKAGEHLEMLPPEEQSTALIAILVRMVVQERDAKEYYKKVYENNKGKL